MSRAPNKIFVDVCKNRGEWDESSTQVSGLSSGLEAHSSRRARAIEIFTRNTHSVPTASHCLENIRDARADDNFTKTEVAVEPLALGVSLGFRQEITLRSRSRARYDN